LKLNDVSCALQLDVLPVELITTSSPAETPTAIQKTMTAILNCFGYCHTELP
jgi:hypothetical protein